MVVRCRGSKVCFRVEYLDKPEQRKSGGIIEYATALPSDIEMKSMTDEGDPKKGGKRGKTKKKGGKKSSAPPSEYGINLKPLYDLDVIVTKSDLDSMTTDPSGMTYVLDGMMAKHNEEEVRKEVEKDRLKKESIKAGLEALEKEKLASNMARMNDSVKTLKKMARRVRSDQNKERVPLSERFEVDASEFVKEEDDLVKNMLHDHLELILDSLTDLIDVFDSLADLADNSDELLKLLLSNKELMVVVEALRSPDDFPMKDVLASLMMLSARVVAKPAEGRVFLFLEGNFPFASVDVSDPRLAFINIRMFDGSDDDERMCQEQSCCLMIVGGHR